MCVVIVDYIFEMKKYSHSYKFSICCIVVVPVVDVVFVILKNLYTLF